TAEGYGQGHSEEIVGMALEGVRSECVIATKVSPNHLRRDDILRSVEQSLRRLRTDYIDIYYVHWPNAEIPLTETMATLAELRDQRVIRSVAVSNFSRQLLEEAEAVTRVDCIQPEYSLLERSIESEVLPYCRERGIGVLTYSSVAKGILTGAHHRDGTVIVPNDFRQGRRLFKPEHLEAATPLVEGLRRLANRYDVTPAEVAIAWILHQPGITSAIVGTQNIKHLEENVRAVELALGEDDLRELDDLSRRALVQIDGAAPSSR
ncbi:aldo/keto reductase, partial [Alicyclobacillus sendaiensis]